MSKELRNDKTWKEELELKSDAKAKKTFLGVFITVMSLISIATTAALLLTLKPLPDNLSLQLTAENIVENYLVKDGEENIEGVEAQSASVDYVRKQLVEENFVTKANNEDLPGITTEKAIDPIDISSGYLLKENELNLEDVNSKSVTTEYIPKSEVSTKYKLILGETATLGITSPIVLSKDESKNEEAMLTQPKDTNVTHAILTVPRISDQITIELYGRTFTIGSTGSTYITDSTDSTEALKVIRFSKGQTKTLYLIVNNPTGTADYAIEFDVELSDSGVIKVSETAKRKATGNYPDAAISWNTFTSPENDNATLLKPLTDGFGYIYL